MIERKRFALNRMASPSLGLEEFYCLAESAGIGKVELRNDIPGRGIIDGQTPSEAREIAERHGIEVITINALQKFNLRTLQDRLADELGSLLDLAKAIGCRAIVLCPNNDPADERPAELRQEETAENLAAFAPLFEEFGITGYVEPLGFGISSLPSPGDAARAILDSASGCYRVLLDTFHLHIGPDASSVLEDSSVTSLVGLVHISGVESDLAPSEYRDGHRVFPGPADRMKSRDQLESLLRAGYAGDVSFEPFSPEFAGMSAGAVRELLLKSLAYLTG